MAVDTIYRFHCDECGAETDHVCLDKLKREIPPSHWSLVTSPFSPTARHACSASCAKTLRTKLKLEVTDAMDDYWKAQNNAASEPGCPVCGARKYHVHV